MVSHMTIGVPREIKPQEHRVALLPSAAYQPGKSGISVLNRCLTSRPVAEAHGLAYTALESVPAGNFEI